MAPYELHGLNLDAFNLANLKRRTNASLFVQSAHHTAMIDRRNLTMDWRCAGYCKSPESALEFSIDSDKSTPYEQLDCVAFDLHEDPNRAKRIRPRLVGADGLSKKLSVPFLKPLLAQQQFDMLLQTAIPECMGLGIQHFSSTFSFAQRWIPFVTVHLVFVRQAPDWLLVYEASGKDSKFHFVDELQPFLSGPQTWEYREELRNLRGRSARVYVYWMRASGIEVQSS